MDLPVDVYLEILQHLDRDQLLQSCLTSPQWYKVCRDDRLWQRLVKEDLGEVKMVGSWYQTYRYWYETLMRLSQVLIEKGSILDLEIVDIKKLRRRVYNRLIEYFKRYYRTAFKSRQDFSTFYMHMQLEIFEILTGINMEHVKSQTMEAIVEDYEEQEYDKTSKLILWFFSQIIFIDGQSGSGQIDWDIGEDYNLLSIDRRYFE